MTTGRAVSDGASRAARIGSAVLMLAVAACTGMRQVKAPTDYLESAHPKVVRVTRADGRGFIMIGAHLNADTLMGFVQQTSGIHQFEEMPLGEVAKLEAEQRSPTRTALAIGAVAVGVGTAWYLLYEQAQKQGVSQFCIDGLYGAGVPCD